ncbi:ankyrin repeat domain-containing protein [Xanthobacteraceae bacterium A53D]
MPRTGTARALLALPLVLAAVALMMGQVMAGQKERDLIDAAGRNDAIAVARLISGGAKLEARNDHGQTALLVATHADAVEAARLLIEAGADVNAKDAISDSPYLYAGARGHLEILRLTLSHGADLKSTNRFGGTALIPAAERGHVETVRTLIAAGVDVNHVNRLGWTALLEAVILSDGGPRHVAIADLLLKAGADPSIADNDGVTALQHAQRRGQSEMAARLQAGR